MDDLSSLEDIKEKLDVTKRTEFAPGVYKHAISRRFPTGAKRGFLPIIAEDYTYTMDIMFITVVLNEETNAKRNKKRRTTGKILVEPSGQAGDMPAVIGGLVLVETTSRKIFFRELHSKDPREVLHAFKIFLLKTGGKIVRLISDTGQEYRLIKKYNQEKKLFRYWQVNASQNNHTALSRVDRAIRTIRSLINNYYAEYENADWASVIHTLIEVYNNTKHNSLFLRDNNGKSISTHQKKCGETQSYGEE